MKRFTLKEMLLVSQPEEAGRKLAFHPEVTVIRGGNSRGKSSLLKSILACFGAEAPKIQQRWKNADVQRLMKFEVEGVGYYAVSSRGAYGLFDANKKMLHDSLKVTDGFGPALAKVLDFQLQLPDRNNESVVPPPAFFFLPFYLDQDAGWKDTWCSFKKLGQFPNFKPTLANYHTGVRPNEYYEKTALKRIYQKQLIEPERKKDFLERTSVEFTRRHSEELFDINAEDFKAEIDRLVGKVNELRKQQSDVRDELLVLQAERSTLKQQLALAARMKKELSADYHYALDDMDSVEIACPTCGQHYDNSLAEQFGIAQDADRCDELALAIVSDFQATEQKIERAEQRIQTLQARSEDIEALLRSKRGAIEFGDLLRSEGAKQMRSFIHEDIAEVLKVIDDLKGKVLELEEHLKSLSNPSRRKTIIDTYEKHFRRHLSGLDVDPQNLGEAIFSKLAPSISESGSALPRAILAYHFSILLLTLEFGSAAYGPVVIDSPKQQEQDKENEKRILKFIKANRPAESQLILGSVSTSGIEFDGKHIELKEKYSALIPDDYEECRSAIMPFVSSMVRVES